MLLKLKRTQRTAIGQLKANVAYEFDLAVPAQKKVADSLLGREMAVKTTIKEMEAAAAAIAERQRAEMADASTGVTKLSAISEKVKADKAAAEKKAAQSGAAK